MIVEVILDLSSRGDFDVFYEKNKCGEKGSTLK